MFDELAVQQVLAHYVRAHDRRDAPAMAALFTPEARVQVAGLQEDANGGS